MALQAGLPHTVKMSWQPNPEEHVRFQPRPVIDERLI